MALNHSVSFVLALLAALVLLVMAGCGSEPTVVPKPAVVPATVDVAAQTSASTPHPKTSVLAEPTVEPVQPTAAPEPTSTPWITVEGGLEIAHPGAATALVEERILVSDVVVKARLSSAGEGILNFRALQYLKGTGPQQFSVSAETEGRPTRWDNQDAVLFLMNESGDSADFAFADTTVINYGLDTRKTYTGDLPEGYMADTRNPVWLPVEPSGGSGSSFARSPGTGSTGDVITEYDSDGQPETISQADLLDAIEWVSGTTSADSRALTSEAVTRSASSQSEEFTQEQVLDCVSLSLWQLRDIRDYEEYFGRYPYEQRSEFELSSSLGKGVEIIGTDSTHDWGVNLPGNQRYDTYKLTGRDAILFLQLIEDDDNNSRNGYSQKVVNSRPLPAGEYRVSQWFYPYMHKPCGYPLSFKPWRTTVTSVAPPGTVHEALFDPATTTAGVGYLAGSATTTGALDAATFSVADGTSATIERIVYASSTVELRVTPAGALTGHDLEFIDVDGAIALTLDPDNAGASSTLAFAVDVAPWAAGDKMMLRVKRAAPRPALETTFTAGERDTGQNWVTGYSDGFVGSIAGSGFTVDGTATAVEAVLWFDRHPEGEVRLGLTTAVDLSGYTLTFSDSAGTEILALDGNPEEVDSSGKILEWTVPELPWAVGDTVRLQIRVKE